MAITSARTGDPSLAGQQEMLQELLPASRIEPPLKWVTPEMVCVRYVHKVGHKRQRDKRVVAVTPTTFFLVHVVGEVRRFVKMAQVEGVVLGKTQRGEQQLWVRCTEPEHDMLLIFSQDIRNDPAEEPRMFVDKLRKIKQIRGEYFPVGDSSEDLFDRARLVKYRNYVPPKKRMDRCLASGFGRLNKLLQEEQGGGGGLQPDEQQAVYEMGRIAAARGAALRQSVLPHPNLPLPSSPLPYTTASPTLTTWQGGVRPPPALPAQRLAPYAATSEPAPMLGPPLHPGLHPALGMHKHVDAPPQLAAGYMGASIPPASPVASGVSMAKPGIGFEGHSAQPYEHPDLRPHTPTRLTADDGYDAVTGDRYFAAHDLDAVERERWDRRRAAVDRAGAPRPEDLGTVAALRSPYSTSARRDRAGDPPPQRM